MRRAFLVDGRGFIWVIGDVFQQYAAKYLGISRGIPLSNSNQLWGLLWGNFVFGELHGSGVSTYMQVIGGSLLMMLGVGAIAFSSATGTEQAQWQEAALRECRRYGLDKEHVRLECKALSRAASVSLHAALWIGCWWPSPAACSFIPRLWRMLQPAFSDWLPRC